jgi:hypothetical protein
MCVCVYVYVCFLKNLHAGPRLRKQVGRMEVF